MDGGQHRAWVSLELCIRIQGRDCGCGGPSLELRLSTILTLMLYKFYVVIIVFFSSKWMRFGLRHPLCW